MLPLYKEAQNWEGQVGQRRESNLGLEYDKFFSGWDIGKGSPDKKSFYGRFVDGLRNYQPGLLNGYRTRRDRLLLSLGAGSFAPGLPGGLSPGWERPIRWRPASLGTVPLAYHTYLPPPSKGMMRAWLLYWLKDEAMANQLFGDTATVGVGRLIVFDALPESTPKLEVDIMNPHYSPYYADPTKPPANIYSRCPSTS